MAFPPLIPEAGDLIARLHGKRLRLACATLDEHKEGLSVAARELFRSGYIGDARRKKLVDIDAAFHTARHITCQSVACFYEELQDEMLNFDPACARPRSSSVELSFDACSDQTNALNGSTIFLHGLIAKPADITDICPPASSSPLSSGSLHVHPWMHNDPWIGKQIPRVATSDKRIGNSAWKDYHCNRSDNKSEKTVDMSVSALNSVHGHNKLDANVEDAAWPLLHEMASVSPSITNCGGTVNSGPHTAQMVVRVILWSLHSQPSAKRTGT